MIVRLLFVVVAFVWLSAGQIRIPRPIVLAFLSTDSPLVLIPLAPSTASPRLVERIFGPRGQKLAYVPAEHVVGIELAAARLDCLECAIAVAGKDAAFAKPRLLTAEYFRLPQFLITAEQKVNGSIEAIVALSYVTTRRILLFPSFFEPNRILTRLASGGAKRLNLIQIFEANLGFRPGTVTLEIFASLAVLHEHSHLNGTALPDLDCAFLSELNTRHIAEACFPEILVQAPILFVNFARRKTAVCSSCHGGRSVEKVKRGPKPLE
jgi:hypothetical protein